ncbi:helix-turn-helix transcriptional regulator [Aliarcobacter butzleri]|uniref:helix-turn-helix transcriptional regulator n=1 Tax=Aliarcobacter butzleri TaxID=28197 RepID=UPI00062E45CE|nr:helix-turn-helix domain-containing protein [Aliarcobacter butzleri]
MNISQKLLRPKEVALYLGIGLSTVWLYAKQGKIKPIKISGKVTVFSIDEINRKFELEDIINNPKQENSY